MVPEVLHFWQSPRWLDHASQAYIIPAPNSISWLTLAVPHTYSTFGTSSISALFLKVKREKSERNLCIYVHTSPLYNHSPTMYIFCLFPFHPLLILILVLLITDYFLLLLGLSIYCLLVSFLSHYLCFLNFILCLFFCSII